MEIYILTPALVKVAVIDYCESIIWTRRYCEAGEFELYIPASAGLFEVLVDGNLAMRSDAPESLMVIQSVSLSTNEETGDYITVAGRSIESWLAKRIVWSQTNLSGIVTSCVTTLLNNNVISPTDSNRRIDNITIGDYCDCSTTITKQITGDNLLDAIIELLNTYSLGFRLRQDSGTLYFDIYEGVDRSSDQDVYPRVKFSQEFDNILTTNYIEDSSSYRSVALVAGEGEGTNRRTYTVGSGSGLDRDEVYVDARDISSTTDGGTLTDDEYNALLAEKGAEVLAESIAQESFEGEIVTGAVYTFGVDYNLGDIVNISNEYGVEDKVRITEVIESWDDNGYACIPTFSKEV